MKRRRNLSPEAKRVMKTSAKTRRKHAAWLRKFKRDAKKRASRRNPTSGGVTQKEAMKALKNVGIVLKRTEYGEYRVNFKGGKEASAYYTDDLQDAIDTGMAMFKRQHELKYGI